jgi:MoaA/NifB/PqqE/SkfB family radical SAM enzyme
LTYAITYKCNSRCTTCNIWQRTPTDELSFDEIRTFFQRSNRFSWIHLSGGEIFLRNDLFDVTEVIMTECRNLLLLNFPTNGLLTDRIVSTVEKIVALKPPKFFITVSMDGDETLNDEIRGVKGAWKRQIETFKQLSKIPGVKVALGMTLSTTNADKIGQTFQAAKKECEWLTYENFHVNIFHTSYYYGNEALDAPQQDSERLIQEISAYRKLRKLRLHPISYLEYQYGRHIEHYVRSGKTPIRCHALRASSFLDPMGNVYPCSMYNRVLSNLRDYNYEIVRIWDLEESRKVQQEIWEYQCPQCWTPCEAYQSILGDFLQRQ